MQNIETPVNTENTDIINGNKQDDTNNKQIPTIENNFGIDEIVPENFNDYELEKNENIPTNEKVDSEFKELAQKLKLNHKQVKEISSWANKTTLESMNNYNLDMEQKREDTITQLKTDWGNQHDANLKKSITTAKRLTEFAPEFGEYIEESKAGNDPKFIKMVLKLGELISEDKLNISSGVSTDKKNYLGNIPVLSFDSMENK